MRGRYLKIGIIAVKALRRNKLRTILTVLGIVIGVASVIAMIEIGKGSSEAMKSTIESMGANNLIILPGTAASGGVSYGAGTSLTLTVEDSEALKQQATTIKAISPIVRVRGQVVAGNRNWVPMSISGATPDFLEVRDWTTFIEGQSFSEQDVRSAAKVCIIGKTIAKKLFPEQSAVGKELRIQNVTFTVVGVLTPKGANMMGMDQDDMILAPWTSIKFRVSGSSVGASGQNSQSTAATAASTGSTSSTSSSSSLYPNSQTNLYPTQAENSFMPKFINIDQILAATNSSKETQLAIKQITQILRERHHLRDDEPDDFSIRDMTEMTQAISTMTKVMTNLLLIVALISLIVGGVGIMNIMLVSVTERTKEIGLRLAVGAKQSDILGQFLIESIVLCLLGGVLGIMLGRGCSYLVTLLLKWPTEVSFVAILISILVSMFIGIIFGFYPAWKASKMNPIEALRYE